MLRVLFGSWKHLLLYVIYSVDKGLLVSMLRTKQDTERQCLKKIPRGDQEYSFSSSSVDTNPWGARQNVDHNSEGWVAARKCASTSVDWTHVE